MTWVSVFMLLVQQVQFIGMLSQLDISWPTEWFSFTSVFNVTNLSFENLIGSKKVPLITFRMIFILVSICVPLLINILLLVIFQPITIVLWYLCLCLGVVFLCIGLAGEYLPETGASAATGATDPMTFIQVGAALLGFSILTLIAYQLHLRANAGKEAKTHFVDEIKYNRRFHRRRALKHCGVFVLCLVIALLCTRLIVITIPRTSSATFFDNTAWLIVGIIFSVFAFLALVFLVVNLFKEGRRRMLQLINFFSKHVLLVLLTLISASFIPTVTYAVSIFMCTEYTCPAGTKFNPYAKRETQSYDTSASLYCDPCNFTAAVPKCGSNVSSTFEWCPAFSDRRSWKHPETSCSAESTYYFYLAAIIVLVIYLIGIPLLFGRVVRYLTKNVVMHARVGKALPDESEDSVWMRQMRAIQPVAASLYDPFRFPRRYFVLVQLAHRLIITMTITVAAAFSRSAVVFVFVFHAMICLLLLVTRPYVMRFEQILSFALAICNVLNAIYAIIVWQVADVPSYTTYVFIVLNGVIPALFLLMGAFLARKMQASAAQKEEKKIAQLELEARDAMRNGNEMEIESPNQPIAREPYAVVPMSIIATQQIVEETSFDEAGSPTALTHKVEPLKESSSSSEESSEDEDDIDPEMKKRIKRIMKIRQHHNDIQASVLNERSTTLMNKAFMGMGIFFIIALGIAFLGLLREDKQIYLVGGESLYRSKTIMLAGYDTWDDFTSHCCCIPQSTPNDDYSLAERWICGNGKTLERGRVRLDGASGLPIRDFCATSFNDFCEVQEDPDSKIVELKCPAASNALQSTSADTQKFLW
jgi:hypothetical protein